MSTQPTETIRVEQGQELPAALALLVLARNAMDPVAGANGASEALLFLNSARTAIEQLVDRLEPVAGTVVYARATQFMERFDEALGALRGRPMDDGGT